MFSVITPLILYPLFKVNNHILQTWKRFVRHMANPQTTRQVLYRNSLNARLTHR